MSHQDQFTIGKRSYAYCNLNKVSQNQRLPFSIKILLENCLRRLGDTATQQDVDALINWQHYARQAYEISFQPARVLMQDFTGVPAIVDLAAMRDAVQAKGGDLTKVKPLQPVEMVIDHSVQVDHYKTEQGINPLTANQNKEYQRNLERYAFLKWGQKNFANFKVVPPGKGIVHQINLEYLARVLFVEEAGTLLYPDTLVGTDSHTTMINGLGVLGWGVGGIEAEAAMLGQPVSMVIPEVIGVRLTGKLTPGVTATDLVLSITEKLRALGVVGKFVEFFGDALADLSIADRATIANMAPEYGATCGLFPTDQKTLDYLALTGREQQHIERIAAYYQAQGMFYRPEKNQQADYSAVLDIDLSSIVPSLAGSKRPQDRINLKEARQDFHNLRELLPNISDDSVAHGSITNGSIVIAAITSCTNTSNPSVMLTAGLVAQKARARGLKAQPWVKTSLAPGSQVVTAYLEQSGLLAEFKAVGFNLVGYGCTTCIGNSGPLSASVSQTIKANNLSVAAVLSGNRNFEGRIHPQVKLNYLASPPLVVVYALAGTMDIDLYSQPIGHDQANQPVYFKDIWPDPEEIETALCVIQPEQFKQVYQNIFNGDADWEALQVKDSTQFPWDKSSTYIQKPPFFGPDQANNTKSVETFSVKAARVLAYLGDSVTTDHISPAGAIKQDSPAGVYLSQQGVAYADFNSYGSRRGNHEVMVRGTFANIRLRNKLLDNVEGGYTRSFINQQQMTIYDAAMLYQQNKIPTLVLAGKEYGSGSSRDWAAKGTRLLGIKVVLAESFERIHRTNLVGMGVLPLVFSEGESAEGLGLDGTEVYAIGNLNLHDKTAEVIATKPTNTETDDQPIRFTAKVRLDTPQEVRYFEYGGILNYVLNEKLG